MHLVSFIGCLLSLLAAASCLSDNPVINPQTLRKSFEGVRPYSDMSSAYYSIKGLELLGDNAKLDTQNAKELCDFAKAKVDKSSIESIHYATSLGDLLPNCQIDATSFQDTLAKADSSANVADLYYYVMTVETLKTKLDSKKVAKSLTDALRADSSILNQGFSLHIAAKLQSEHSKVFYDNIEDILDQADQVDKVNLQYEGGVGTTGIVLEGMLALSEKVGALPAKLTSERVAKFVNYLISKRYPTNIKSAYYLLKASVKLSNNKFLVPLFLTRQSNIGATDLLVSLTNLLGGPVKQDQLNLEATSATSSNKAASLFAAKKSFTVKSSDRTLFEVKLVEANAAAALTPAFYAVTVGLVNAPKQFFLAKSTVEVKVTTKVAVEEVQMGVSDVDTTNPKFERYEGKSKSMEADQQSKLTVKFEIKDLKKNSLVEAHQAFLKFTHVKSGKEIIYLAESSLSKNYMVEVDFAANAKNFRYQSGAYSLELIVSDNLFENPSVLKLSEMKLKFSSQPAEDNKSKMFAAKPEIKHIFRVPDVRPPQSVSMIFTLLCLVPLALMVALWFKIGFNFAKFEVSVSAIVFHLSLASIFVLYYCYWTRINMFETVRYLGIIGFVAFFAGNKLLKSLASKKEKAN